MKHNRAIPRILARRSFTVAIPGEPGRGYTFRFSRSLVGWVWARPCATYYFRELGTAWAYRERWQPEWTGGFLYLRQAVADAMRRELRLSPHDPDAPNLWRVAECLDPAPRSVQP